MTKELNFIEKSEHDAVIQHLARVLTNKGVNVKMNLCESKKNSIDVGGEKYYPDIFSYNKEHLIEAIYEVETTSSVSEQSIPQWKIYSSIKARFFLIVPKSKLDEAKKIIGMSKIKVNGYWTFGG